MEQIRNDDEGDNHKKFPIRDGTSDIGRLYEAKLAALLALRSVKSKNMVMASNVAEIGDFDDIVLFNTSTEGKCIAYLVQLKHQVKCQNIKPSDFENKKDFSIHKYQESFNKLNKNIADNPKNLEDINGYFRGVKQKFFVLYTNKGINAKELEFLNKVSAQQSSDLEILTTGDSYSFNSSKLEQYQPEFLNQLILLPNQPNCDEIDDKIKEEIIKLTLPLEPSDFDTSEICKEFVQFIVNWAQSKSHKQYFLTKRNINAKLVQLLLHRYRIDFNKKNYDIPDFTVKCNKFIEIISDKEITVLNEGKKVVQFLMQCIYSEVVKHSKESKKDLKENLSEESKKFYYQNFPTLKLQTLKILNVQDLTLLDIYTSLWLDQQLPLLLKIKTTDEYKNVVQILELFPINLRVILLNKTGGPLSNSNTILKRFETLDDLTEEHRNYFLKQEVKLQGKPIKLEKLIDNNMLRYITSNDIVNIILNDFNIGNLYEPPSDYFIQRSLYRILIDSKVLKQTNDELFLIENPLKLNQKFLNVDDTKICKLDQIDDADFNVKSIIIAEKNKGLDNIHKTIHTTSRKTIHWLKFNNVRKLEWKKSLGSTKNIKLYQLANNEIQFTYTIEDICEQPNRTHILSASPGMGKSTLMDFLAYKNPNNMWTIKINLNQHRKYYETEECQKSGTPASKHLEYFLGQILGEHKSNIHLIKTIFEKFVKEKKILVICDGYDEISISFKKAVINMAKCFQEAGLHLWLTTRPHVKFHLEEELNSISIDFKPFTRDDQETFLIKYFTEISRTDISNSTKKSIVIKSFANQLLDAAAKNLSDQDYEFMGIPLQTKLLADAFKDQCLRSIEMENVHFNHNFNLVDLYEKFINGKIDIRKQKFDAENVVKYRHIQEYCALRVIFNQDDLLELKIEEKIDQFKEIVEEGSQFLVRDGIMITENEFIHRTFAEYLSAKWLVQHINNENKNIRETAVTLLSQRLNNEYKFLFNIIDRIVSKNYPVQEDIIKGNFEEAEIKLRRSTDQLFAIDELGKSLLHVLAIYGNDILNDTKGCVKNIAELLLNNNECVIKTDKHGYNPLDYAIACGSLIVANEICGKTSNLNIKINIYQKNENGDTAIHVAARMAHINLVKFLISTKENIENVYKKGDTIIHKSMFLSNDAYINIQNVDHFTPLHCAAKEGHVEIVKLLLEKNADINTVTLNGYSALHHAAVARSPDIIPLLLRKGMDINRADSLKRTPLHFAANIGQLEAVKLLLSNGADINLLDSIGNSVLHHAAIGESQEIISLLLCKGMDINRANSQKMTPLHLANQGQLEVVKLLLSNGADINLLDSEGLSVLHHAAIGGSQEIISLLLCKGMDINRANSLKRTPLHLAALIDQLEAVKLLLSNGADINLLDFEGLSVLDHAAIKGSQEIISLLLCKGMDINRANSRKRTPLHFAVNRGQLEAVKLLLSNGADINLLDSEGLSVLHHAAIGGSQEIISLLLCKGMDINRANSQKRTPLHFAANWDQLEAVKLFLSKGADINMLDSEGRSVLHHAAIGGSQEIISLLLCKGMDINRANSLKRTPLHFAANIGQLEAVKLLLSNDADINLLDSEGLSVLDHAAIGGSQEIILLLLCKGMDINRANSLKRTPLHLAALNDQLEAVKLLLSNGADINLLDSIGNSVLHYAVARGSQEIISLLLLEGMNINQSNSEKSTPLHLAANQGQLEVVKLLLSNGADINLLDSIGNSVLHHAAIGGSQEIISLLLCKGMDINRANSLKRTPLHLAALNDQLEAVKLLLSNGADINLLDSIGNSVLQYAVARGSQEIISLLLLEGMNINQSNSEKSTPLHLAANQGQLEVVKLLLSNGADINLLDSIGNSVLQYAVARGSQEIISLLLLEGMNINQSNSEKSTPLHLAANQGQLEVVKLLLSNGADINLLDSEGLSVLHHAAIGGSQEIISLLLCKGMDINRANSLKRTPLHLAALNDQLEAVKLLLSNGADINLLDSIGNSVLHYAVARGSQEIISLLLLEGMNINQSNSEKSTPLHLAANQGQLEVVKLLLSNGADINLLDSEGLSVLHHAAIGGSQEIISLLLLEGMDINKSDLQNRTPLHLAANQGKLEVVKFLLSNGADISMLDSERLSVLDHAAARESQEIISLLLGKGVDKYVFKK